MSIWDDPASDWTTGEGLRAVQLFERAYPDARSARSAAEAAGLVWSSDDDLLAPSDLWVRLLRRAAGTGCAYALAADLLHEDVEGWLATPLRQLLGDHLPEANRALVTRHGVPVDAEQRRLLLERVDAVRTAETLVAPAERGALQSITAPEAGLRPQEQLLLREAAVRRRVAMIYQGGVPVGTGFLVGPDRLLTAAHVVRNDGPLRHEDLANLQAGFDRSSYADVPRPQVEDVAPVPVVQVLCWSLPTDDEVAGTPELSDVPTDRLDYALLRLARRVGEERATDGQVRGSYVLDDVVLDVPRMVPLYVYHHPLGGVLTGGFSTAAAKATRSGARLRYGSNTLPGSSGGLVLSQDGRPVALHHYGQETWNQGVPIWLIARHIHAALGTDELPPPPPAQDPAPHLALQAGGKPIVDREGFRSQLWDSMTRLDQPRQLLVVGPVDSGVSWSYKIVNNVAGYAPSVRALRQAAPNGITARIVDLRRIKVAPDQRRGELIREIAAAASGTAPDDYFVEQAARHVSNFRNWCMERFAGRDRQFWLFIDSIDDIAEISRHDVDEVLTALVDVADDQQSHLYLVLAGREAHLLGHDALRWTTPDTVSGLSRQAVRSWLLGRVSECGGIAKDDLLEDFLDRWFSGHDPVAEPERLSRALPAAVREVCA